MDANIPDLKEMLSGLHHTEFTSDILCLECATIFPKNNQIEQSCPDCGYVTDIGEFQQLYEYGTDAVRYGHYYNNYYKRQKEIGTLGSIKPCLADPSTIQCFIGTVIVSGIISGASWDLTKTVISKIVEQLSESNPENKVRIEPTIDMDSLDVIYKDVMGYHDNMSHIDDDIVPLVIEEMWVHTAVENLDKMPQINRLVSKGKKKKKNLKKAKKLHKKLMAKNMDKKRVKPTAIYTDKLWSKIER